MPDTVSKRTPACHRHSWLLSERVLGSKFGRNQGLSEINKISRNYNFCRCILIIRLLHLIGKLWFVRQLDKSRNNGTINKGRFTSLHGNERIDTENLILPISLFSTSQLILATLQTTCQWYTIAFSINRLINLSTSNSLKKKSVE